MPGLDQWPIGASVAMLVISGLVLIWAGTRFTLLVDQLADRIGIGEALAGAVLLGATTSLPGIIVTSVAASTGDAELAVSNAFGGIAAQTMFLALADLTYRRANLEHAAASVPNLLQALVLVILLGLVFLAHVGPQPTLLGVHPITPVLLMAYLYGLFLTKQAREAPMWRPLRTRETRLDVPKARYQSLSLAPLLVRFAGLGALVAGCGMAVAAAGLSVTARTGLSATLVGGLVTSVVTSLPELVTVLAAVRAGALTLAVADIIGGNAFDVLFVAVGDVAYRDGSIYAAIGKETVFLLALTLVLTGILAAGLVLRQRRGIGFEGVAIIGVYFTGMATLAWLF